MDKKVLDTLFLEARSHKFFLDRPVSDDLLQKIYSMARMAPTAWNTCPMRITFARSPKAREKLLTALSPGNVDKTKSAPVTAIMAIDKDFPDKLDLLAPAMAGDPVFSFWQPDCVDWTVDPCQVSTMIRLINCILRVQVGSPTF